MKYRFTGYNKFLDPEGYPAVAPPWGTLNAINLNTGEYAWKIPLGEYPELAEKEYREAKITADPIVTAGGLLFIGATNFDRKFRAFDKSTGKLLWETTLPFSGQRHPGDLRNRWTPICGHSRGRQAKIRNQAREELRRLCPPPSRASSKQPPLFLSRQD